MRASASVRADEPSNAADETSQAAPNKSPDEMASSKSRKILKERTLRTVNTLRTALPIHPGTFDSGVDVSTQGPRFGDLSWYKIVDKDEKYLWEIEINRIMDSLDKPQQRLDSASSHELASSISNLGFAWLERVSDQLLCALSICALDDNLMTAPEPQTEVWNRGSIILRSFDRLETRLGSKLEIIRNAGIRERETSRREPDVDDNSQYVLRDGVSGVADSEAPTYYHLVDYVTETVARLLCQNFSSDEVYWVSYVITALAKYSTKLKVLSRELPGYGVGALNRHSDVRRLLRDYPFAAAENPSEISLEVTAVEQHVSRDPDPERGPGDRYVATYASDMITISNWLFRLLWHILKDLNTRNTRNRDTDEFEVSSVVFATAGRCIPAITFQNRLGHVSGSSSGVAVGMARRAIDLISNTAALIEEKSRQELGLRMGISTLSIKLGNTAAQQDVNLKSMADLISIMTISSCMDPSVMDDMIRLCASLRVSHILSRTYDSSQGYTAFVTLHNTLSIDRPLLRRSHPLSDGLDSNRATSVPHQLRQEEQSLRKNAFEAIWEVERQISSTRKQISDLASKWAIEEHAIGISCLRYTISIMSGCAILVLGGLMAGFFVGSRIEGVDPFNLTMFAWIIAGFIILVSKSIRVGEWTWRDFLKGRVTCRTVRELANVTNLPEQHIIMFLLSSERENALVLRGPYNNVFSNTGAEGFSVDVKPTVATLFASGLIVLEVLSESGSALVCLDIRPHVTATNSGSEGSWYELDIIGHGLSKQRMVHRQRKQCRVLACKDPPLQDETAKDILFRQQLLHWEKIIGVYNRPTQTVR
ncbi:uncharacterized protein FPRO_10098 [Fusarium proliferatum ET1]|uniref:Uncharacterized protein n=1 Tax=Fusarium proliferatum (strain ET1) TaxID=1227346 RepID=A0A1L7VSW1_FUSPR|nr:uncharacterized protein FPRO_10098 [Fusarium proliferatum ET1]CZR42795.1 uncharacterized protein FPRO_10098 [Fusarium proliferatum ET1]